jgi:hypothetical protein
MNSQYPLVGYIGFESLWLPEPPLMIDVSYDWLAALNPIAEVHSSMTECSASFAAAALVSENPIAFQPS